MFRFNFSRFIYKVTKLSLLLGILYIYASTSKIGSFNYTNLETLGEHDINSVNLVIAHPDDEVMFFAPSLINLNEQIRDPSTVFNIICFSNGGADGLGNVREQELSDSIAMLLPTRNTSIVVLDFKDGMKEKWDVKEMIAKLRNIVPKLGHNVLLTFDGKGVSGHLNHIACYRAALGYYNEFKSKQKLTVLSLQSYSKNIVKKYSSYIWELIKLLYSSWVPSRLGNVLPKRGSNVARKITIFSTYPQYVLSLAAMLNAHKTQVVWFRYGWWFFSRLVFVNDLDVISS
ncbi:N-acetylglucosaminylphosphatidylinositol deacetylase KNAG_0J00240 [Huiozyma naganishii CBS 8797]|uniref:N-acetylglucosaminylphosphatidylinositol deacetylase n=1 Tax=Huiozyma naganishii (strain ATCC MYA-139 / BCRC 22969 / CBS 8797 / KCTC 17520 / NBRC 10181 / NCYC 3082 / Yp74L-3) TaxID=1071383 RepID=J7S2M0_HUIN7|nr:hypothetical protein KNAG_0J00240 [Kazachstania naganishii CBS 8797]CCK72107.1 hypothetical protein KNAG_0J00240 [Kazachstania naganishii CBS 8797]